MNIIGAFTQSNDGFSGQIVTLSVQSTEVRIVAIPSTGRSGATHRVMVGAASIGEGRPAHDTPDSVLSLTLDDPSFVAPIFGDLVPNESQDGFYLIWRRAI